MRVLNSVELQAVSGGLSLKPVPVCHPICRPIRVALQTRAEMRRYSSYGQKSLINSYCSFEGLPPSSGGGSFPCASAA